MAEKDDKGLMQKIAALLSKDPGPPQTYGGGSDLAGTKLEGIPGLLSGDVSDPIPYPLPGRQQVMTSQGPMYGAEDIGYIDPGVPMPPPAAPTPAPNGLDTVYVGTPKDALYEELFPGTFKKR